LRFASLHILTHYFSPLNAALYQKEYQMNIEEHQYTKLLDYAKSQMGSYHMEPGLSAAKMTEREFESVRESLFLNAHMQVSPPGQSEVYDWRLRPEAVFGYLTYKQYDYAQKSSKRALYIPSVSLIIAAGSLVVGAIGVLL
jgi:uncharacterized protein (DUF2164 family)